MSNGNFKVRCVKSYSGFTTDNKIYSVVNGVFTYDDGHPDGNRYYSVEEMNEKFVSRFEPISEPSTEYISIIRKKNRVVATITKGEDKYTQSVMLSKANNDYKTAVKMVVERLMERWNGFDGEEIEAVDKPLTADGFDWEGFKSGKFAVHCDTEEKAREFLNNCDTNGVVWCTGDRTTRQETRWGIYKKDTCYGFVDKDGISYGTTFSDIPKIDYTPSKPTVNEVHRPAMVGEWIKVVNAGNIPETNGTPDYKNGDILKIIKNEGVQVMYSEKDSSDGRRKVLNHSEYVVLENYQPEEPKPMPSKDDVKPSTITAHTHSVIFPHTEGIGYQTKRFVKAKVGDKIEIVKVASFHHEEVSIGQIRTVVSIDSDHIVTSDKETGCNTFFDADQEYIIIENKEVAPQKPDISILDSFTFEDIAKYLFHKVGDGK